jgi:gamma-glutamyl-gamma-aminobutyrate hydrolase PuuD
MPLSIPPLIAIAAVWGADKLESIGHDYTSSVHTAGGIPLIVPGTTNETLLDIIFTRVDGVLVPGGVDINPYSYNEDPIPELDEIQPPLDDFQLKFINAAVNAGLPLFAICRGHQLLNVYFGGTLHQDIPTTYYNSSSSLRIKHKQTSTDRSYVTHTVSILNGTHLKTLLGQSEMFVNSFHHQAVKDLAPGLKVSAVAPDGIIEATERIDNPKIFSVQWHPEGLVDVGDLTFLPLFQYLVDSAKEFRDTRKNA